MGHHDSKKFLIENSVPHSVKHGEKFQGSLEHTGVNHALRTGTAHHLSIHQLILAHHGTDFAFENYLRARLKEVVRGYDPGVATICVCI